MPELPEVETVRKGLEELTNKFYIKEISVLKERSIASEGGSIEFVENIEGSFFGAWSRRGKYLIASLHNKKDIKQGWIVAHLRMTGYFQYYINKVEPCRHTRIRFWDSRGHELRFIDIRNFGQMWWFPKEKPPENFLLSIKKLGPEPFSNEFNYSYLKEKFKGKKRSIKAALLDQRLVAGAGNIYADESLFLAGVLPYKETGKLTEDELKNICHYLKYVMEISIGKGGTTFSDFRDLKGINGKYGGQAWVYGRHKKSCRKCKSQIQKIKITGRSSHWCSNCQS